MVSLCARGVTLSPQLFVERAVTIPAMCGRYTVSSPGQRLVGVFRVRAWMACWFDRLTCGVSHMDAGPWSARGALGLSRDTLTMIEVLRGLWKHKPAGRPSRVYMVLTHLVADGVAPMPLYEGALRRSRLADAMDRIGARYGAHTVYWGAMFGHRRSAPMRISYTQIPQLDDFTPSPG